MAGKAIRSISKAQQRWIEKTVAKFLPYGKNTKQWNLRQEVQCPRCHQPAKDKNHITKCQSPDAQQQRDSQSGRST